jgi:hypothetical protein
MKRNLSPQVRAGNAERVFAEPAALLIVLDLTISAGEAEDGNFRANRENGGGRSW